MTAELSVWAVIPAAGVGSRMGAQVAKQYLEFQGKTLLEHCLDRLLSHPLIDGAVLALKEDDAHWQQLDYQAAKPVFITHGGEQRQHSVYSGLTTLQYRCGNNVIALVHDAVRPLVTHAELDRVIAAARNNEAGAILACAVTDTLKRQDDAMAIASTEPREGLWRAQTPQVFHLSPLLNALSSVIDQGIAITDDAQAIELQGYRPTLVESSAENLKITTPDDLRLAEIIWSHQRDQQDDE